MLVVSEYDIATSVYTSDIFPISYEESSSEPPR